MLIDNELYKLKSNKIHVILCSLRGLKFMIVTLSVIQKCCINLITIIGHQTSSSLELTDFLVILPFGIYRLISC